MSCIQADSVGAHNSSRLHDPPKEVCYSTYPITRVSGHDDRHYLHEPKDSRGEAKEAETGGQEYAEGHQWCQQEWFPESLGR